MVVVICSPMHYQLDHTNKHSVILDKTRQVLCDAVVIKRPTLYYPVVNEISIIKNKTDIDHQFISQNKISLIPGEINNSLRWY